MIRRFRNKDGFADNTDFIEVREDGCYLIYKQGGERKANSYSLGSCLDFVDKGSWEEIIAKGYHTNFISKGELGELSKIEEEFEEFKDAVEQCNPVMALQELSDMVGAIEAYLENYHPSIMLPHLIIMNNATKKAFKDGTRN